MKNGRYIFILTVLTLLLFGASKWLSVNPSVPQKQSQPAQVNKKQANLKYQRSEKQKSRPIRMVTLYPAGSIAVSKTSPKKELQKKKKPTKTIKVIKPKTQFKEKPKEPVNKTAVISPRMKGDRPTLEVGYEEIGFESYIDVIERIGRLFILVEEKGRIKLGPEVSLKRRELFPSLSIGKDRYALDRPHLISDPFIKELLSGLTLPSTAITDRVVLIFNSPFDNMLWQVIGSIAVAYSLDLGKLSRISGKYIKRGNGIFLQLSYAVMKDTLKKTPFRRTIRVTLG
jgi:hypothetical protein